MAKDIHNLDRIFERTAEKYFSDGGFFPEDLEDIKRYCQDGLADGLSTGRVTKYLSTFRVLKRDLGKPLKSATMEDIKAFIAKLERSDYTDWTKHDRKVILRRYMRWLGKDDTVDWMKIRQPKNGQLPQEILTEEDIKGLAEAAYTVRDRAFVLSLYESGCRIGELLPLKIKQMQFDRHGAILFVSGKTGERRVRLVASALALQRWLDGHPSKNDPNAYLWCKIPMPNNPKWKNEHLSYGFTCRLLRELAQKAGVKKRTNPHAFRHARATFMANRLTEAQMKEYFGWGKDSDMAAVYVHLSGRDVDDSVLSIYGIKESADRKEPVLKTFECPRCREQNDGVQLYCGKCGLPFSDDVIKEERLESVMVDFIRLLSERVPEAAGVFQEVAAKHGLS